jgi:predicted flap endonuclease-1-like 5' DNA nuclease
MANIKEIEGIGPANEEKLKKAGISTTEALLKHGASKAGRKSVADASGLSEGQVLSYVNMSDLMRVKGVGGEFSELLHAAGVDTLKELRNRNAANLHAALEETNAKKKLTRRVPSLSMVEDFVDQAKKATPLVTY